MELILDGINFEIELRESVFYISDYNEKLEYSLDCYFKHNEFDEEIISPYLCINDIKTNINGDIQNLVGEKFKVETIEEADEREDTFYIFEHEPLESYELTILEIKNNMVHIKCEGVAVIDGYSSPYTTGEFKIDCWLPIRDIG